MVDAGTPEPEPPEPEPPERERATAVLDGSSQTLDPRVRVVWMAGSSVLPAILLGIALLVALMGPADGLAAVLGGIAVVLLVVVMIGAHLRWRRWSWSAWDDALELRHGVVVSHASLVPYHRIQQIDVHRGPVERMVGIASLVLRTASATTDATIPGIALEKADVLRHSLLRRAGADDAV